MQNHAITKEMEHKKEAGVRCLRENRKIMRQEVVKRVVSNHHFHIMWKSSQETPA